MSMVTRNVIKIDEEKCTGCGKCILTCAEGALKIVDGKAKVVRESYCDGLGACLIGCPTGALTIEQRVAEAFSEDDVKEHLAHKKRDQEIAMACPSAKMHHIPVPTTGRKGGVSVAQLANWPIQLRLAHPNAPYFKKARLLLAADCTAFSYGSIHSDFIKGRVTLIGCPKLDEAATSVDKLAEILIQNEIVDITLLHMEVPCCSGLVSLAHKALTKAGKKVPLEEITIGTNGEILERK
jgi:ferredoxin